MTDRYHGELSRLSVQFMDVVMKDNPRSRLPVSTLLPLFHWPKKTLLTIGFCAQWERFSLLGEPGSIDSAVDTGIYCLGLLAALMGTQRPGEHANFDPFPLSQP